MTGRLEYWKTRVTVASIMVGYTGSAAGVTLGILLGLVLGIIEALHAADLAALGLTVLWGLLGVVMAAAVLSLVLGVLGLATGAVGAALQLALGRKAIGFPAAMLSGAALGWLMWLGTQTPALALTTGHGFPFAELGTSLATGLAEWASILLGLIGGGLGAFQAVAFVEVMDRPRRSSPPPATP